MWPELHPIATLMYLIYESPRLENAMTKYCPVCDAEYKDTIALCSDDHAKLLTHRVKRHEGATAQDIYAAASEAEAERIVSFLQDEGIHASSSQSNLLQLPSMGDLHYVVTVPIADKGRARALIHSARQDGVISDQGAFA
jgi:hypothetical protein